MADLDLDLIDVLETSPVGTVIVDDRDRQVLFWNTSVLAILGGLHGEAFALSAKGGFFHSHTEFQHACARLAETGTVRNLEARLWRADGEEAWAEVSMRPIRFEGQSATLIWYSDISEAKRRQRHLERSQDTLLDVLDTAPTGAALSDAPQRISYWNRALIDIFPGQGDDQSKAIREGVAFAQEEIARNGQGHSFRIPTADGRERYVASWKAQVEFEGEPSELVWLHDVTELRLAERAAHAATAAKSAFLATMSHEIRTPMNGVVTIAELLADTRLDTEQAAMVDIIRHSAEGLIRVVNDILDFSKLEARQLHVERVPFLLRGVIEGAGMLLSAKASEKGLALDVRCDGVGDTYRVGDPLRLRQVLLNLLGNAIKFTNHGKVVLSVDANGPSVSFAVTDTGIGIPAHAVAELFQPYRQAETTTARNYGGTGLGLTISNALVHLMGGDITVASEPGRGSCFSFTLDLPVDDSQPAREAGPAVMVASRWTKPDRATAERHGAVILCAEDNVTNRDILVRVLDRLGICCDLADDGAAALASLDRGRHGLVLTDGHMPKMDGWALAQAIRQDEAAHDLPRLPVLMVTANAMWETEVRARDTGIDACLTKPLRLEQLEAALLAALPVLASLRSHAETAAAPASVVATGALDLRGLIELVGEAPADIAALLEDFRASALALHDDMRNALAAGDAVRLAQHAHSLKGAAAYAGAGELSRLAGAVEAAAKRGAEPATLGADVAALDAALARLPADIARALERQFPPAG